MSVPWAPIGIGVMSEQGDADGQGGAGREGVAHNRSSMRRDGVGRTVGPAVRHHGAWLVRRLRCSFSCVPMYIDRHDVPGVSPEDVANAHLADLDVQERHGVQYHTYWFDPACGSVFCLAEGPSKQAVAAVHDEAHGLLASSILELSPGAPLERDVGINTALSGWDLIHRSGHAGHRVHRCLWIGGANASTRR